MAEKDGEIKNERALSALGVSVSSEVYGDGLKPSIQPVGELVGGILQVPANLLGVPLDWFNTKLRVFREQMKARIESIPQQDRAVPPLRIGCNILREATFAIDEPELQRMFAELLASASDARKQSRVHPSFGSTISRLSADDATFLQKLAASRGLIEFEREMPEVERNQLISQATALISVGLVEIIRLGPDMHAGLPSLSGLGSHIRRNEITFGGGYTELGSVLSGLEDTLRDVLFELTSEMHALSLPDGLQLTKLGQDFVAVCMPVIDAEQIDDSAKANK